jgi:hypothetical protein
LSIGPSVLAAVELALEVPTAERRACLSRVLANDADARVVAERLLSECERCEEADLVAAAVEEGERRYQLERGPFAIDLAALLAEAEGEGESPDETCGNTVARHRLGADTRLGGHRIVRFVAAGGMGEVYEAVDERLGRRVAIKVLPAWASVDRAVRFAREAILMGRLEHPAIGRLYESGRVPSQDGGGAALDFMAMEFIEGVPLGEATERIRKDRPLDPRPIVELLLPIIDAVAYAHARGVLHRDIKPANILVESSGKARLLDFGVAALLGPDDQLALTATGDSHRPGTLAYMSPEQVRGGSARVTTQSDIYALGLVLAESLTGRRVAETEGRGIGEVVEDVLRREPAPIVPPARSLGSRAGIPWRSVDLALWHALDFVVRRALRKDPAARQSSAAQLAEDLRRVLAGEQPSGRRLGKMERLVAFAARHRRAVAIGAAAVVVTGVAVAFGAAQFVRAREAEVRSELMIGGLLDGSRPLVVDLNKRLLEEGQPLAVRRAALEATVRYLEWVQQNAGDDARVLSELAERYHLLGRVAGSTGMGSLGDAESARLHFERSRAILDQLLSRHDDKDLRMRRASLLREYGGLFEIEERERLFRLAAHDQRAAVALMPDGAARDEAERALLTTEVQAARKRLDLAGFTRPIARFREIAGKEPSWQDAEFLSEYGLALRCHADVLERKGGTQEALATARDAERAFCASIALGLDEFTNNRHLARIEFMITRLTSGERRLDESLASLVQSLARARKAAVLRPGDSFARASHLEAIILFAGAARGIAQDFHAQADSDATHAAVRHFVDDAIEAFDAEVVFTQGLPLEGAPHTREAQTLEDVANAREALSGVVRWSAS